VALFFTGTGDAAFLTRGDVEDGDSCLVGGEARVTLACGCGDALFTGIGTLFGALFVG
jgi:hypothetical protein